MTKPHNIQDPVWGQIEVTEEEWLLLNLPSFQRLRRIHQLAMTMLVFPGTTHTRFEHSLGVCHAAGLIADALARNDSAGSLFPPEDRRIVRLAGLLHDIGHGPFSHVSDQFLGDAGHETLGAMIVMKDPGVAEILDEGTRKRVAGIITAQRPRTVARDLVSGPADADKVDYLLRDSYYAGTPQGQFDHLYFIDQAIAVASTPDTMLGFGWKGLWAVEGMILARHHMHRTVYGHPKRLLTDLMLRRGMTMLAADGVLPKVMMSAPTETNYDAFRAAYEVWDDWAVMTAGVSDKTKRAKKMFERLRQHSLLKVLLRLEGLPLHDSLGSDASRQLKLADKQRLKSVSEAAEPVLARALGIDADLVFVVLQDPDNPLVRPAGPAADQKDILIKMHDGQTISLSERSEILSGIDTRVPRHQLLVYGPEEHRNTSDADEVREKCLEVIRQILIGGGAHA